MTALRWDFWIDRGGTFTDVDRPRCRKASCMPASCCRKIPRPTATPRCRASATCWACGRASRFPPGVIGDVRMGTTVATNALLERKGERTLLVTTRGFRDALRIGYQARPRIFDKKIVQARAALSDVLEVTERVRADGAVEQEPDLAEVARAGSRRPRRRHSRPSRSSSCTPTAFPRTSGGGRARARDRLSAGLGQPRGEPAHQAGRARRHHGGRRLSLADPVALRGAGGGGTRRGRDPERDPARG